MADELKTRSFTMKVSESEHGEILKLTCGRPITSEWLRGYLLDRARRDTQDEVVVGELLAVRTVVLTALARIAPTTDVRGIVEAADKNKRARAKTALTAHD